MNRQDVMMLQNAMRYMGDSFMQRKMREQQEEQRKLENQLRQEMTNYQRERDQRDFGYRVDRDRVGDGRYNDETGYRRGRDQVTDQRYNDETGYRRGRDQVTDQRDQRDFGYRVGRDRVGDDRAGEMLNLQKMAAALQARQAERGGAYVNEELDPESGEVMRITRRRPFREDATEEREAPLRNRGSGTEPPPAAIAHLRKYPDLAPEFDQKFGPGASRRYLK